MDVAIMIAVGETIMAGQSDIEPERILFVPLLLQNAIVIDVLLFFKIHEYSILEDQKSSRLSRKNYGKNYQRH